MLLADNSKTGGGRGIDVMEEHELHKINRSKPAVALLSIVFRMAWAPRKRIEMNCPSIVLSLVPN